METFRFENINFLYILFIIPIIIIIYWITYINKKKSLKKFGQLNIINQLMPYVSYRRPIYKFTILLFALCFIIIGICGPQFGSKLKKIKRKGVEIVIALDVSNSMLARDIQPNRLERAKRSISKLVDKLNNDKIGLIVFAGEAYTQLPITSDYSSAKLFLSTIDTDIVPIQGTSISSAINLATRSFSPDSEASKAIIIITDGENHEENAVEAARMAGDKNIVVHTIGMGLAKGAPIPNKKRPNEYIKDKEGNIVVSKLNELILQQIAVAGKGISVKANNTSSGLNTLYDEINKMDKTNFEEKIYSSYNEKFQIFIALGLFLLLIDFIILERKNKYFKDVNIFK